MSVEQVVFIIAGAVCIVGAVIAATHRDPRVTGISLTATLLALAVLYAELAAPAVAAAVIVVSLFATLPLVVHLTVPDSPVEATGPSLSGAALLLGAALFGILAVVTTFAYLVIGAILFATGAIGVVVRTSAVGRLVGVELMLAAATLTFAASGVGFRELDGQVAALLVVVVAAAQAIAGYALAASHGQPE